MKRSRLAALLVVPALLLTGCSAGVGTSESAASRDDSAGGGEDFAPGAPVDTGGATAGDSAGSGSGSTVSAAALAAAVTDGRDLVRTATLTVRVDAVDRALTAAGQAVTARGGFVAAEQTFIGSEDEAQGSLTLRVPVEAYERLLDDLAALGTVLDRQAETVDVTEDVVDVASRVETAQAALGRVRALLDRAVTIADVVTLEGELTARQSELESLLARQRSLADRTALSTVALSLVTEVPEDTEAQDGFVAGLRDGWDAFTSSATGLLTALGAVLPFAVLALVLGAGALGVRRVWRRRHPGTPSAPAATAPAPQT